MSLICNLLGLPSAPGTACERSDTQEVGGGGRVPAAWGLEAVQHFTSALSSGSSLPKCAKKSQSFQKEDGEPSRTDCAWLAPATGEQQQPGSMAKSCMGWAGLSPSLLSGTRCLFCSSCPTLHPTPLHMACMKSTLPKTVQEMILRKIDGSLLCISHRPQAELLCVREDSL